MPSAPSCVPPGLFCAEGRGGNFYSLSYCFWWVGLVGLVVYEILETAQSQIFLFLYGIFAWTLDWDLDLGWLITFTRICYLQIFNQGSLIDIDLINEILIVKLGVRGFGLAVEEG